MQVKATQRDNSPREWRRAKGTRV